MKHLFTSLLILQSIYSYAQPRAELGISAGMMGAAVNTQKATRWNTYSKSSFGVNADILGNKFTKPFSASYGLHILSYNFNSYEEYDRTVYYPPYSDTLKSNTHYQWLMFALPIGAHYKLPYGGNTALRLSAYAGPLIATNLGYGANTTELIRGYAAASVSLMLNNKLSIGCKATKIFGNMGNVNTTYDHYNQYGLYTVQGDIRLLLPSPNDLKPETKERLHRRMENHREAKERYIAKELERKNKQRRYWASKGRKIGKMYMDVMLDGGMLLLSSINAGSNTQAKYVDHAQHGFAFQGGIDAMIDRGIRHTFASFGCRLGYMSFSSSDSFGKYSGNGLHSTFNTGIHYVTKPGADNKLRIALYGGGGLRLDNSNNYGTSAYYYFELNATKHFSKQFAAGISIARYTALYATRYDYKRSYPYSNADFNGLAIMAQMRVSLYKNKKKR